MISNFERATFVVALAAGVCLALPARASSVATETATVAPLNIAAPAGGNVASGVTLIDVVIQPFDNNLGTLEFVRILADIKGRASRPGVSGGSLSYTVGGDLLVNGIVYGSVSKSGSSSATPPLSPRQSFELLDDNVFDAASSDAADVTVVSAATGNSPYSIQLIGDQTFSSWSSGVLEITGDSVTVEYTYIPIPEPTSVGLAFVAVFAGTRRR